MNLPARGPASTNLLARNPTLQTSPLVVLLYEPPRDTGTFLEVLSPGVANCAARRYISSKTCWFLAPKLVCSSIL